jgi:hypothetical protein
MPLGNVKKAMKAEGWVTMQLFEEMRCIHGKEYSHSFESSNCVHGRERMSQRVYNGNSD